MTISRDVWHPIEMLPEEYRVQGKYVWIASYYEPSREARKNGARSFWKKSLECFLWWSEHSDKPAYADFFGMYPSHFMITDDSELAQTTNPDITY